MLTKKEVRALQRTIIVIQRQQEVLLAVYDNHQTYECTTTNVLLSTVKRQIATILERETRNVHD